MQKDSQKGAKKNQARLPEALFGFILFFILFSVLTGVIDTVNAAALYETGGAGEITLFSMFIPAGLPLSLDSVICALIPAGGAALLIAAAVLLKRRDGRVRFAFLCAFLLTAVSDIYVLPYCASAAYIAFRLLAGTALMGAWAIALYQAEVFRGYAEPLEEKQPPLLIGGMLLPVAFWLLAALKTAVEGLLNIPISYILASALAPGSAEGGSLWTPDAVNAAVYAVLSCALSIYAGLTFFKRRKSFIPAGAALAALHIAYVTASALISVLTQPPELVDRFEDFSLILFTGAFQLAIDAAVIVYLLLSRRARKTFVYGKGEAEALAAPLKRLPPESGEPLPLWGPVLLVAIQSAQLLRTGYFGVLNTLQYLRDGTSTVFEVLAFAAVTPLAVWCFMLLFQRRRIFKWVFLGLAAAELLYFAVPQAVSLADFAQKYGEVSSQDAIQLSLWTYIIIAIASFLYRAFLIAYMLLSRRVRRTFVNQAPINLS